MSSPEILGRNSTDNNLVRQSALELWRWWAWAGVPTALISGIQKECMSVSCITRADSSLSSPGRALTPFDVISAFIFHFSSSWYFSIEYAPLGSWALGGYIALLIFITDSSWKLTAFCVKIMWTTLKGVTEEHTPTFHVLSLSRYRNHTSACRSPKTDDFLSILSDCFPGGPECYRHGLGPQPVPLHSCAAPAEEVRPALRRHRAPRFPHRLAAPHRVQAVEGLLADQGPAGLHRSLLAVHLRVSGCQLSPKPPPV